MQTIRKVFIVGGKRIPFCRSHTKYMGLSNLELITPALKSLVAEFKLEGQILGEASFGAVSKHQADWGFARECVMESGLSPMTPAYDIQKACATSLETIISIGNKIALGQIECGIAGGADTNSDVPLEFSKKFSDRLIRLQAAKNWQQKLTALKGFAPKELMPKIPAIREKRTGLSMGESAEVMAKTWGITRLEQDELAYESHRKGTLAYESGFFNDLITPCLDVQKDNLLRPDTTMDKLAKLKPSFDYTGKGTLTAGNSSSLTDGAAAVFLASEEYCLKHKLTPLAVLSFNASAAVNYTGGEGLLMAPPYALAKLLRQSQMNWQDFDFYEIHEAFAAQVLCNLKALNDEEFCRTKLNETKVFGEINREKLNINGGSLALGHPFAATGARIVGTLAKMISQEKKPKKGVISICTAGGMGVTAILESV